MCVIVSVLYCCRISFDTFTIQLFYVCWLKDAHFTSGLSSSLGREGDDESTDVISKSILLNYIELPPIKGGNN